jgi:hypothetical protein
MGSWTIGGNVLSITGTLGVLGTQDNNALAIETNKVERLRLDTSGNVGIGTSSPQKPLDVAASGGLRISQTAQASSANEIYFSDNGQIRSLDDNHRIIFNRAGNELELREFGTITFSSGATQGQRTAQVVLDNNGTSYFAGNLGIGLSKQEVQMGEPSSRLVVAGNVKVLGTAVASSSNELYFADNGQIRSLDDNHRIVFNRAANEFEIREFGQITFSPGATQGQRTAAVSILPSGDMTVTGDVILTGADCAEEFDISGTQPPDPGTVVVIDQGGALKESREAYDKKVAGVVSGAGEYRHGLVLDRRSSPEGRIPVALVGKVYCKVDARYSPIGVGDLLTTSDTPGHAMKAAEPAKAFGAVIGKALAGIGGGQGLIPIMVALQ